ncbi:MAG: bacterio-opsin activator domain-containing protein [Haloferacaceae archaeon]
MGTDASTVDLADVRAVFERQDAPGTPLTAPEVADAVGCARRTAYNKLERLTERDALETKKVGANARVWWRPASARQGTPAATADVDRSVRQSEQALRELHDASRELMRADTHETVCAVAVGAARRILGLSLCGLWLYDADRDVLDPVEWTESGVEEYGEPPPFPIEGSLVGRAFREGDYRAYDDISTESDLYDPETDVRSELVLPLGGHGVLNASSPEVGAFDAVDVSLARILAATVETALDRADQLERRRERRRELKRQRDELGTLNRLNALVEEAIGALVGAASRDDIESTVCDRLAASEFYVDAWVVERDSATDALALRTSASGRDPACSERRDELPRPNPVSTAIDDRSLQVVSDVAESDCVPDPLRTVADESDTRSCLVAPLSYADTVFGALVVHAPEPDAFSDREQTAFETLGQVVGFAINATNNRRLLLGNTAVELEVTLGDDDAWFQAAADRLGGTVTVEGLVPMGDGHVIEYVTVEPEGAGMTPAEFGDAAGFEDVRVLAAADDQWFLECIAGTADAGLGRIAEYGATIRSAEATDGSATVTARFPSTTSPREAMTVVREAFPDVDLAAKRVVDVSDRSVTTIGQAVSDRLTEKQEAVLRAAFLAGYYDAPRGTTAAELAESLNVVPSTLYQHMQAAHRKLLGTVFSDLAVDRT